MKNFQNNTHSLTVHEYLLDLYERMIGDVEIPAVLGKVADVVRGDLNAERATVYLIDKSTQELEAVAIIGNVAQTIRIPIQETSLAGFCALSGRDFLVDDAYSDLSAIDPKLHFDDKWDQMNDFRTRDVMCASAMFRGEVLGVVQVLNSKKGRSFDQNDLNWLKQVSRLIGYALYHAKLHNDLATLKQLETEKAKFMRVMVHELKSPVAATKMLSDTYQQYHNDHPKIDILTNKIGDRMDQLLKLIADLLELSKVKSGEPMGEVIHIDLVALIKEISQQYQEQAIQKNLELIVELPPENIEIRFDCQGCRMVVSNLISNAVKYTNQGSVTVSLIPQNNHAVFKVTDTGMGIPEKDIPKMFQEFFRASNARKSRIQGSGVGLAGVKNLVERFGGRLELHSRENQGSTFTVFLPLCPKNSSTTPSEQNTSNKIEETQPDNSPNKQPNPAGNA